MVKKVLMGNLVAQVVAENQVEPVYSEIPVNLVILVSPVLQRVVSVVQWVLLVSQVNLVMTVNPDLMGLMEFKDLVAQLVMLDQKVNQDNLVQRDLKVMKENAVNMDNQAHQDLTVLWVSAAMLV